MFPLHFVKLLFDDHNLCIKKGPLMGPHEWVKLTPPLRFILENGETLCSYERLSSSQKPSSLKSIGKD